MKCGNCGELTKKETYVSLNEVVPMGKGTANLVQKVSLSLSPLSSSTNQHMDLIN